MEALQNVLTEACDYCMSQNAAFEVDKALLSVPQTDAATVTAALHVSSSTAAKGSSTGGTAAGAAGSLAGALINVRDHARGQYRTPAAWTGQTHQTIQEAMSCVEDANR
jgi:hypothetical protein